VVSPLGTHPSIGKTPEVRIHQGDGKFIGFSIPISVAPKQLRDLNSGTGIAFPFRSITGTHKRTGSHESYQKNLDDLTD